MTSIFSHDKESNHLVNYQCASQLSLIQRSIKIALDFWIKKDINHIHVLQSIINEALKQDTIHFSLLPLTVKNLLINPKEVLPLLHPSITDEMIGKVILETLHAIVDEFTQKLMNLHTTMI